MKLHGATSQKAAIFISILINTITADPEGVTLIIPELILG
jgi:hypothetical protein